MATRVFHRIAAPIAALAVAASVAETASADTISFSDQTEIEDRQFEIIDQFLSVVPGSNRRDVSRSDEFRRSATLTLPRFDSSLGTLNSVRWDVTSEFRLSAFVSAICTGAPGSGGLPFFACGVGGFSSAQNTPRVYLGPATGFFVNGPQPLPTGVDLIYGPIRNAYAGVGNFGGSFTCLAFDSSDCFNGVLRRAGGDTRTVTDDDVDAYINGDPQITIDFFTLWATRHYCQNGISVASWCQGVHDILMRGTLDVTLTYDYTPFAEETRQVPVSWPWWIVLAGSLLVAAWFFRTESPHGTH